MPSRFGSPARCKSSVPASVTTNVVEIEMSEIRLAKKWICLICGYVYDETVGAPEHGIPPGTPWEAIPADWRCPLCDVSKSEFVSIEF
ncbi:rubredoxin [Paraburkholderia tropica]|uniref:rubredoxin n=1 Tax=Paraburkholderia tropica TaxID=92647 RepID=UPI0009F3BCA9